MSDIIIWHNPKCSKSREALGLIQNEGYNSKIVKYLEDSISENEIKAVLKMLGIGARELMRTKEDIYKELNLANEQDEGMLIRSMAKHPILIERPIIIKENSAIIGRPNDKIIPFLKKIVTEVENG